MSGPLGHGRIASRLSQVTGEVIPVESWVSLIHPDDWDWFERWWLAEDEFDYRLRRAGVSS